MRKQSIIITVITLIGFAFGFLNTLLFTNKQWFTASEYGVSKSIYDFAQTIYAFSFLGVTAVMYKFSPYYKAHVSNKKSDLMAWSIISTTVMFLVVAFLMYFGKDFFEKKFIAKSPELIKYYFWLLPLAYFLIIFYVLEAHLWSLQKPIITNVLREIVLRIYHLVLILLFVTESISFQTFVICNVFTYTLLCLIAIVYLLYKKEIYWNVKPSIVTKKFLKKMAPFGLFIYIGTVVVVTASLNDSFTISSFKGQDAVGILAIATFITNLILVPQKSANAVMIPQLAVAWREKKMDFIAKIYKRSSINMLLAALFVFGCIWLCFEDAILALHMKPDYLQGKWLLFFLGLKAIIDMGTGVNGQIIATSNFWKFEFLTGVILLLLIIPLNYFLIKEIGIVGAGIANVIAYTIYNIIRLVFLQVKYKMQPFSINTLWSLLFAFVAYCICNYSLMLLNGWVAIFAKCILFSLLFLGAVYFAKLSPDVEPVLDALKNRWKKFTNKI